ncbi:serine hydrolase domain-containing protein [Leucobacter denitrificans]|uniref:serine hydrolase domain-containing protein n=1 Tax=Leucobacter denitrificans TaxID=683042 RepID=UPI003618926B
MFSKLKSVRKVAILSVLTVAALGLTACTGGEAGTRDSDVNTVSAEVATSFDEAVANALTLSGSTEAVVGVWNGDTAYVQGFGDGVDAATRFRAAQSSQPVMCALLLSLVEEGELSLDRKITKDLTRQSGVDEVTYRQLCDQTSGLADFKKGLSDRVTNNPTRPWPEQELIAYGLAESPLPWAGENVNLSDTNALVLDRSIRLHTHLKTANLLQLRVFTPAGMTSSSYPSDFDDTEIPQSSLTPLTYPSSGGAPVCEAEAGTLSGLSTSMIQGAGASLTTVTDLKKFYDAYLSGDFGGGQDTTEVRPAKNPERDEQGNPTSEPDTEGRQIGFGGIEKIGPLFGRSGSVTGTISAAYSDPETGLTVIVALNNSSAGSGFAQALAFQLAALTGAELPWTAEEQGALLTERAVCQTPPEEAAE